MVRFGCVVIFSLFCIPYVWRAAAAEWREEVNRKQAKSDSDSESYFDYICKKNYFRTNVCVCVCVWGRDEKSVGDRCTPAISIKWPIWFIGEFVHFTRFIYRTLKTSALFVFTFFSRFARSLSLAQFSHFIFATPTNLCFRWIIYTTHFNVCGFLRIKSRQSSKRRKNDK